MKCGRLYPLLAGSWAAFALLSGGCADQPKRERAANAAGTAGTGGRAGGAGGLGGNAGFEIGADAGASGAIDDPGIVGAGGVRGEAGDGPGGDTGGPQAGSGGEAGEVDTFSEPCPSSALDGWASVSGLDFDPSLRQPAALEVFVSTATDLASYAASPDPYIIHVTGTIAVPVLDVTSNKTIIGDGPEATLEGGIRIAGTSTASADMVSNIVIKNLHINAQSSAVAVADDLAGIGIAYAHHVWIDHVDIWDAGIEGIDISHGSDYVSVSWVKFRLVQGTQKGGGVRVGHGDTNAAEDSGRLKVTLHHNFWTDSLDQRMPRVRFGDVHVFDNYFSHSAADANSYCVAAAINSRLLVENNYFDQVQRPHVFFSFDSTTNMAAYSEPTAQMVATGNTYLGRSDDARGKHSGQGDSFTPPYSVTLEPADTLLKQFVRHCSGPR